MSFSFAPPGTTPSTNAATSAASAPGFSFSSKGAGFAAPGTTPNITLGATPNLNFATTKPVQPSGSGINLQTTGQSLGAASGGPQPTSQGLGTSATTTQGFKMPQSTAAGLGGSQSTAAPQTTTLGQALGASLSAGTVSKASTSASLTTSGLGTASAPSLSLTTTTGAAAKPSLGTTTAASAATTTAAATTATSSTSASTPKMTYKELEDQMNKWWMELDHQEKVFLEQATKVNAWDKILIENGQKITNLNSDVEKIKLDQHRLTHELDFILAQQKELEEMLVPLEDSVAKLPPINYQQHTDTEREHTYQIAENIDAQLKRMTEDLKEVIDHLNTGAESQDSTDPMLQISKILNAHMESLQWVDQNAAVLQRKTEEVSRYADITKKEHERNFRLAYS